MHFLCLLARKHNTGRHLVTNLLHLLGFGFSGVQRSCIVAAGRLRWRGKSIHMGNAGIGRAQAQSA
jgi:hypothetical protein